MESPDLANLKITVSLLTDQKFHERHLPDLFAHEEVPEHARGFKRGPRSLLAIAEDASDFIKATAVAHLLEHPGKQPLLYVASAGSDPPYREHGLEFRLVNELMEAGRTMGISGVSVSDDVAVVIKVAGQSESR